jgi:hypothetical protein
MIIVTVVSLSENVLDLNKGIFFYGFFFSILLLKPKTENTKNSPGDIAESGNPGRFISV